MEYLLVVLIYAGVFAKGDNLSIQTIPGWVTKEKCEIAGKALAPLVNGSAKEIKFVCIPR